MPHYIPNISNLVKEMSGTYIPVKITTHKKLMNFIVNPIENPLRFRQVISNSTLRPYSNFNCFFEFVTKWPVRWNHSNLEYALIFDFFKLKQDLKWLKWLFKVTCLRELYLKDFFFAFPRYSRLSCWDKAHPPVGLPTRYFIAMK